MTDTSNQVTPQAAVAYLLDGGEPGAIRGGPYSPPWDAIVAELAEAKPEERGALFEAAADKLGSPGADVRQAVYAEARSRFSRDKSGGLDAVNPALEDDKPVAPDGVLIAALKRREIGNAELFAQLFGNQAMYDHSEKTWYLWSGQNWEPDKVRAIVPLASTQLTRQYSAKLVEAQKAGNDGLAKAYAQCIDRLCGRRYLDNVLTLATSLPVMRITGDEWDQAAGSLGVANGVVDLTNGTLRPGAPGDMMRKICPTQWKGIECPAPLWEQFLREIFVGDDELIGFVHRLLGYGITGSSVEHVFPILYGTGRNGKSTLLETLASVLGEDLTMSIPSDALMLTKTYNNAPQPFIHAMRGKRTVWATETNPTRYMDAGLIKLLTGGDTLAVRTVYATPIQFKPSHLLLLLTNYKPKASAEDVAIWDRVHLVPFDARFVAKPDPSKPNEHPRDANLHRKLREEASGILAWLVRGAIEWSRDGLNPPDKVLLATQQYRDEENTVAQFVEEECAVGPDCQSGSTELYKAYSKWCKDIRVRALAHREFSKVIMEKFKRERKRDGSVFYGIGLPMPGMFAPNFTNAQQGVADVTDKWPVS